MHSGDELATLRAGEMIVRTRTNVEKNSRGHNTDATAEVTALIGPNNHSIAEMQQTLRAALRGAGDVVRDEVAAREREATT